MIVKPGRYLSVPNVESLLRVAGAVARIEIEVRGQTHWITGFFVAPRFIVTVGFVVFGEQDPKGLKLRVTRVHRGNTESYRAHFETFVGAPRARPALGSV